MVSARTGDRITPQSKRPPAMADRLLAGVVRTGGARPMSSPHSWPDYSQANSVHQMLLGLSPQAVQSLFDEMRRECLARGIVYEEDDGTIRAVPVLIRPRLLAP